MDDSISRQAAIDAVYKCTDIFVNNLPVMVDKADAYKALAKLPSAQPTTDEWCHDCKEYDQERNCCPRFNRVIRTALKDAKPQRMSGRWIRHKDWVSEGYCEYSCSECDMGVDVMYNYCPRCGADMREGQDG